MRNVTVLGFGLLSALLLLYWVQTETSSRHFHDPPSVLHTPAASSVAPDPRIEENQESHPIFPPATKDLMPITLESSDAAISSLVQLLLRENVLPSFLYPDKMIRRFVATVDNLPRKEVSARLRPFKPVVGAFDVQGRNGNLAIDLGNARRYEPYVSTVESLNVQMAVKFYATHYSLFQEAYRDLGYPKGQFNDRLFEAIDDMLATPTIAPPIALVQPKVLYRYADPVLENASAGQKMMLRMGVNNAIRVKAVLRKFREGLMYYGRPH